MSSDDIQSPNLDDATSSASNVTYKNSSLHRRVQSVIRSYHEEKSKETSSNSRFIQQSNSSQRKEEETFERRAVSFYDQIQPSRAEPEEASNINKTTRSPHLAQVQSNISQPDYSLNTDKRDREIYIRGRKLLLDGAESHASTSNSLHQGRQINTRLQDRVDEDIESILSFFRDRLNQYEMGKLRRQGEFSLELTTNIHQRLLRNRAISRSTNTSKRALNAGRYEQNDDENTKSEEAASRTSRQDMDKLRLKLRENLSSVRYRIHSSRALLGKHYDDPSVDDQQSKLMTETTSSDRILLPSAGRPKESIEIPERCNLLTSMTDDIKFNEGLARSEITEEPKSLENGWTLYTSTFCERSTQDTGDLPSLSTKIPNRTETPDRLSIAGNWSTLMDKDEKKARIPSPKQIPNSSEGTDTNPNRNSKKPTQTKAHPITKSVTTRECTAFDPFPSSTSDSWNDFASPISDFSSNIIVGTVKLCDASNDNLSSGESASASGKVAATSVIKKLQTANDRHDHHSNPDVSDGDGACAAEEREVNSIIETSETENETRETSLKPKATRRGASFLYAKSKRKSSETGTVPTTLGNNPSDKSVSSSHHSSTRNSSFSCDMPVPVTCTQSPTISKNRKRPGKKGKSMRSLISSFPRAKAANKEWRVKSSESEHVVERKRDKRMREWLNGGNASGQGTVQGSVMETVFYDTRQE